MTNKEKAKKIGINTAIGRYEAFISHKEYLGSNWGWNKFPVFVAELAKTTLFLCLRTGVKTKNIKELEKICYRSAKEEVEKLMKDGRWQQTNR